MIGSNQILESFRSFSFGGLLFAGLAAVVYFLFPGFFQGKLGIGPYHFIIFSSLLGAGLQNRIHKALALTLPSIGKVAGFYENLGEAYVLRRTGVISEAKYQELISKIVDKRFLNP